MKDDILTYTNTTVLEGPFEAFPRRFRGVFLAERQRFGLRTAVRMEELSVDSTGASAPFQVVALACR